MRRSRLDIQFGRQIAVGQTWRCGCCRIKWRVRQVHRSDCTAELVTPSGEVREFRFEQLRQGWEQVQAVQQQQRPKAAAA